MHWPVWSKQVSEYAPAVRAQLHVHTSETREPERAARRLTSELVAEFPRQRPTTLIVLALGPHPGLTPTPWLLDGVFAGLIEAERTPVNFVTLGDAETGEAVLRKAGREGPVRGSELIERPNRDRQISLRSAGRRRPLTFLRELVGSNVIVCAPLTFVARERRQWQGPLGHLLTSLAYAHGYSPPTPKLGDGLRPRDEDGERAALAVGHELLEACFANAAMIFDATWAAALELPDSHRSTQNSGPARGPDGRFLQRARASEPGLPSLLGELAPVDRVLGLAGAGRTNLPALLGVDRYLASVLGLGFGLGLDNRAVDVPPELVHSPGRWPTLQLPATQGQSKRLADRAISGLRSQATRLQGQVSSRLVSGLGSGLGARAAAPAALPARVPGEFASLWTRDWYGEHDLGRFMVGTRAEPG